MWAYPGTAHIFEYPHYLRNELRTSNFVCTFLVSIGTKAHYIFRERIIIGSDRRPETKQGIEGKIDRFRSGKVTVRVRVRFRSPI